MISSTQLETKVSVKIIQYIPACNTHTTGEVSMLLIQCSGHRSLCRSTEPL